ncbi:hypothetical protein AB0L10_39995, partial [Streptomyces flaveolus]
AGRAVDRAPRGGPLLAAGLLTACAVLALAAAAQAVPGRALLRGTLLAAAAGASFGMASVLTKAVTMDGLGHPAQQTATPAVTVVLAVLGLLLSQAALRGTGLAVALATATVVNPLVAAVAGIILFGETFQYGPAGRLVALLCAALAATGLIRLTTAAPAPAARPGTTSSREAPAAADPDGAAPGPARRRQPDTSTR